jgi:uncharacterized protein
MTMKIERRTIDFVDVELKLASDKTGTFSGYGAVFGNVDSYGDVIERGAFAKSLKSWQQRGKWPKMLLQHGGGMFGGADDMLPVGQWTHMNEDERGLRMEGRLFALDTERGRYIHEGLTSGELDGLSIGFETEDGRPNKTGGRDLHEIKLWEVSIVTFPANDLARTLDAKSIREFEDALRDGGLSQKDAVIASSVLKSWLQRDAGVPGIAPRDAVAPEEEREAAALLASLDIMTAKLMTAALAR